MLTKGFHDVWFRSICLIANEEPSVLWYFLGTLLASVGMCCLNGHSGRRQEFWECFTLFCSWIFYIALIICQIRSSGWLDLFSIGFCCCDHVAVRPFRPKRHEKHKYLVYPCPVFFLSLMFYAHHHVHTSLLNACIFCIPPTVQAQPGFCVSKRKGCLPLNSMFVCTKEHKAWKSHGKFRTPSPPFTLPHHTNQQNHPACSVCDPYIQLFVTEIHCTNPWNK